jgi:hypothetical protein
MVKPAFQLEEFAALDELEGIRADDGGAWGSAGGERERRREGGKGNRVSLVRTSKDGKGGFVVPDPHRQVKTGW